MTIAELLKEYKITIKYSPNIVKTGKFFPLANLIIINSKLDLFSKQKILLHELGHAIYHNKICNCYQEQCFYETEANTFCLHNIIMNFGTEKRTADLEINLANCSYLKYKQLLSFELFYERSE
jgi:Zn-dependent peptidase ImmA (M78 family)